MKCVLCGCSTTKENPVYKDPDPYNSEINNDDTEVWECQDCRKESERDI